ncbi:MAG: hypothetical protein SLAVMIC_00789 [uncultured marine phage]|uniref:Uncharacterized protein n=1 Tax=uncultured marine phage TaxID=707152 RepID=A0A8D9CC56_9VIRU|nr:MAG: hypothetical protein SLAVMIC_00789 [uncultured marine phage]
MDIITRLGILWMWGVALFSPVMAIFIFTHLEIWKDPQYGGNPDSNPIWLGIMFIGFTVWFWYMIIMDFKEQNKELEK